MGNMGCSSLAIKLYLKTKEKYDTLASVILIYIITLRKVEMIKNIHDCPSSL